MKIEVFGIGCESCKRLEENAKIAVRELGISAEIIKVDDFEVLIRRGITATPGLAIDGIVVTLGEFADTMPCFLFIGSDPFLHDNM